MANGNQVSVQGPDGNTYQFPPGTDKTAAIAYFKKKGIGAPDLKTGAGMQEKAQAQARAKSTSMPMKTSSLPGIVRGTASVLPVIGGTAGALLGAPAFGGGAVVGGGLGTAGGIAAQQAIDKGIFGEGESPISKAGLKEQAVGGVIGGVLELPGALVSAAGSRIIKNIALARDSAQVGDVVEGLMQSKAAGVSSKGIQRDILLAKKELNKPLGEILNGAKGTADINVVLNQVEQNVKNEVAQKPALKALVPYFKRQIEAAKLIAGIKGNQATASQLREFQNAIDKMAFRTPAGPVQEASQGFLKDAYRQVGGQVSKLAPEADPILRQYSNLHAASKAIKAYQPGKAASIAASAYLHPTATAIVSPIATVAAATGAAPAYHGAKSAITGMMP
jgi:hypothetical protein